MQDHMIKRAQADFRLHPPGYQTTKLEEAVQGAERSARPLTASFRFQDFSQFVSCLCPMALNWIECIRR